MHITTEFTGSRGKLLLEMAEYFVKELKLNKLKSSIVIKPAPKYVFKHSDGAVNYADGHIEILISPKLKSYRLGIALAHEFVHASDIARGTLRREVVGDMILIFWGADCYENNELPYLERPWEIKALSNQEILVRKFDLENARKKA